MDFPLTFKTKVSLKQYGARNYHVCFIMNEDD